MFLLMLMRKTVAINKVHFYSRHKIFVKYKYFLLIISNFTELKVNIYIQKLFLNFFCDRAMGNVNARAFSFLILLNFKKKERLPVKLYRICIGGKSNIFVNNSLRDCDLKILWYFIHIEV
jgi:hypothetical protein